MSDRNPVRTCLLALAFGAAAAALPGRGPALAASDLRTEIVGRWVLVVVDGAPPSATGQAIGFGETQLSTKVDCNHYRFDYQLEDGRLSAKNTGVGTLMACGQTPYPPERPMILKALEGSMAETTAGKLSLTYDETDGKRRRLVFDRAPE